MAFKFYRQETFRKAIPRIARERIDHVIESLSEKPHPGAESIHEARKNLKSLRALLRLARGSIDDGVRVRENIFFRDTGRSLSTIRDTEALLEALEYFRKRHPGNSGPSTPKQESIRAFIEKTREDIQKDLVVWACTWSTQKAREGSPRGKAAYHVSGTKASCYNQRMNGRLLLETDSGERTGKPKTSSGSLR